MNKSFFYKDFKYWLKENRSRFICTPYISNVQNRSFHVMFQETNGFLIVSVTKGGQFTIWSRCSDKEYLKSGHLLINDWIEDFDYALKKEADGSFYCDLCRQYDETEHGKFFDDFYDSRKSLLRDHCYGPFLKWCNKTIIPEHHIVIYPQYTKIGVLDDILKQDKDGPSLIFRIKGSS